MRKSKHLPGFILILTLIGILGAPFSLSELAAQDRIPACPPVYIRKEAEGSREESVDVHAVVEAAHGELDK